MAGPAPDPTFADLFANAAAWVDHEPDYSDLMANHLGHAAATTQADASKGFHNLATRSPVAIAVVLTGDEDHVQICHSPSLYPGDLTNPVPTLDGLMVLLTGVSPDLMAPIVLANEAWGRINATRCDEIATLIGAAGHGAAPVVVRTGPHAVGTGSDVRVRRAHLLPTQWAADAISYMPDGRYTLPSFYQRFLHGKWDDADADLRALCAPTAAWFRAASTNVTGGDNLVRVAQTAQATLPHQRPLNACGTRRAKCLMSLHGVGGPQLSSHAFRAGMQELRTVLTDNHNDSKAYHSASKVKSFADKHGAALESRLLRFCGVADAAHLPTTHGLLVNAPRGREPSILNSQFAERALHSPLPVGPANAPLVTPSLLEHVFRSYAPMNNGLNLGLGLTPFAIVCEGHDEVEKLKSLTKSMEAVETGATLTLADAAVLTTNDIRLPTNAFVAGEKLCGWSVVVDVFHGTNAPISDSVRTAVQTVLPYLHRVVHQSAESEAVGMELICRVLFEFQQDYFDYLTKVATGTTGGAVPDFQHIVNKVLTFRVNVLSTLPATWYAHLKTNDWTVVGASGKKTASGSGTDGALREQSGTASRTNPSPDQALLTRYKDSGHASIRSLIGDHSVTPPKVNGQEICLMWALRGSCTSSCKRKAMHKTYSRDVNQKIHALLDTCGVAAAN